MEFIEKHKRLLVFYYTTLRIFGWILLCLGGVGLTLLILEGSKLGGRVTFEGTVGLVKRSYPAFVSLGLFSLGFAQLVKYLCGNSHKRGLLLRYGDKIFYLCAIIAVWRACGEAWLMATGQKGGNSSHHLHWFLYDFPMLLLYRTTKAFVLVGLGLLLKKLIVVIESSRLKTPAN
ncbi:MAG: hypothetical protein KAS75_01420 [Planctomycetes bacterium]|nr:hypothetical protein [Planctomycetota bacterium]